MLTPEPAVSGVEGRHWLLDLADCQCARALLADRETLEAACVAACHAAGLRVVGQQFHQFTPAGVTGVVLLAESHLAVHTWPEQRFAAVDVYVCNHSVDNSTKGADLAQAMTLLFVAAQTGGRCEIRRGSVGGGESAAASLVGGPCSERGGGPSSAI